MPKTSKVMDLRDVLDREFHRLMGSGPARWREVPAAEMCDKRILIRVQSQVRPGSGRKLAVYKLFDRLYADLEPRSKFSCPHVYCFEDGKYWWEFSFKVRKRNG